MLKHTFFLAALLAPMIAPTGAFAQVSLGGGAALVPQFEGSSDYQVVFAPDLSFDGEKISLSTNGAGVEMDLLSSRAIDAGPILRYAFGRNGADIDNAQVSALPDIADGLEAGAYVQVNVPVGGLQTFLAPRLSVVQGVQGGARGTVSEASLGLVRLQGDWTFGAQASASYANADYMNSQFGVAAGSASGLAAFKAGAGVKDVGLSLFASYKLNDRLSVTGVAGYSTLMNDAASSPIVSVAGSKEQMFLALGLSYSFN